jgi:hypothetical protein
LISINAALSGKWVSLACHETGSLVVQVGALLTDNCIADLLCQHAFENLEPDSKAGIVAELLHDEAVFREVVKNQWGSFCISHCKDAPYQCY